MTDSSEPTKEPVQIAVSPLAKPETPPQPGREAVRIQPQTRPSPSPEPTSPTPAPATAVTTHAPKKETARIAPSPARMDDIPMSLSWGLFAASAAILILQIWNYLS